MSNPNQENPSQLSGHLQYVKGVASEMIGNATNSTPWKESGRQDKQAAIDEMRAAKQQGDQELNYDSRNPSTLDAEGKAQGIAGGLAGCGGMQERGAEKQQVADQKLSEQ